MIGEISTPATGGTTTRVGFRKGSVGAATTLHGSSLRSYLGNHELREQGSMVSSCRSWRTLPCSHREEGYGEMREYTTTLGGLAPGSTVAVRVRAASTPADGDDAEPLCANQLLPAHPFATHDECECGGVAQEIGLVGEVLLAGVIDLLVSTFAPPLGGDGGGGCPPAITGSSSRSGRGIM